MMVEGSGCVGGDVEVGGMVVYVSENLVGGGRRVGCEGIERDGVGLE